MLLAIIAQYFFGFTIFMVSVFMILLILVQRGRGGGLVGALGGPGGQSAFGTKAGDLFTRITVGTAAVWIVLLAAAAYTLKERALPETGAVSDLGPSLSDPKAETKTSGAGAANPETPPATSGLETSKPAEATGTAPSATAPADIPSNSSPAPASAGPAPAETPAPSETPAPAAPAAPAPTETPAPESTSPAPGGSGN